MTQSATAILGLLAQTSIHAGTGSNTGVIDLPIQREAHSNYPCVFGSSMKGALRVRAEQDYPSSIQQDSNKPSTHPTIAAVFGADHAAETLHAGALMVGDARLVLLPVRSLTSQFKWVTSPYALQRLADDLQRFNTGIGFQLPSIKLSDELAWTAEKQADALFLEEYRFKTQAQELSGVIKVLAQLMRKTGVEEQLKQQLVVVSDDMFSHLAQHTTPVNAHIAIESATKTVKGGALWYEETLPPETLLYVGLAAYQARKQDSDLNTPEKVLTTVINLFTDKPWLQIGGNETVGMGWCAVSILKGA
ncbi:MAG: type III-B CRISPR module RAMP protein Cmr4 [Candidatus Thiocaldithrix dubininis]|uniref:Type III-B CRISPR module RAMP protein Cmr4 n=1 Tax=Candidatus Thiocaldithrix dubininis TaxID=3080823 RepID=A0AA95H8F6_9GAMM|nr:MAG: type III-B CRISPR module RAMP protein Cmr4 [Candidatus Thiocaldithrix dubininis]